MSISCSVSLLFVLPVFSHADTPQPRLNSAVVLAQCQPTAPFQGFFLGGGGFANLALKDPFPSGCRDGAASETVDASKAQPKKGGKLQLEAGAQLLNK